MATDWNTDSIFLLPVPPYHSEGSQDPEVSVPSEPQDSTVNTRTPVTSHTTKTGKKASNQKNKTKTTKAAPSKRQAARKATPRASTFAYREEQIGSGMGRDVVNIPTHLDICYGFDKAAPKISSRDHLVRVAKKYRRAFHDATTKKERNFVVDSAIEEVDNNGGRFLIRYGFTQWRLADRNFARRRVRTALKWVPEIPKRKYKKKTVDRNPKTNAVEQLENNSGEKHSLPTAELENEPEQTQSINQFPQDPDKKKEPKFLPEPEASYSGAIKSLDNDESTVKIKQEEEDHRTDNMESNDDHGYGENESFPSYQPDPGTDDEWAGIL